MACKSIPIGRVNSEKAKAEQDASQITVSTIDSFGRNLAKIHPPGNTSHVDIYVGVYICVHTHNLFQLLYLLCKLKRLWSAAALLSGYVLTGRPTDGLGGYGLFSGVEQQHGRIRSAVARNLSERVALRGPRGGGVVWGLGGEGLRVGGWGFGRGGWGGFGGWGFAEGLDGFFQSRTPFPWLFGFLPQMRITNGATSAVVARLS